MSVNLTLYPLETELGGVFWLRANGQEGAHFHYLILAAPAPGHAVSMSCMKPLFGTWASNTALLPPEEDFFPEGKKKIFRNSGNRHYIPARLDSQSQSPDEKTQI